MTEHRAPSTEHRGIDRFLQREIDVGSFPGAVYAVGSPSGIEYENALGKAIAVPLRIPATLDTIYDCASITKPLITTTLILQAVADGRLSLDDSFEGFRYRDLLTHTSGLKAWLPLYAYGDYLKAILEHGHEYERGKRVVYSDLNFVLLWLALRHLYDEYVSAASERIFAKLGLDDAMFRPGAILRPRIAATEWSQRYEREMSKVPFDGFREGLIWGETHDGNSHHAGGTAGNAGLFATARAVYRLAQGWLGGTLVARELLEEATRNYTSGLEENRGLGWLLSLPGHAATGMLSPRAFGHTGFTGTSIFIDPDRDRIMVLLTNRVHPCASPIAMQKIRGEFHRLAIQ
ncbi:MAG TPA: serine hydrolase domain-containing protein [Thermoanaerobaculia bacterium]